MYVIRRISRKIFVLKLKLTLIPIRTGEKSVCKAGVKIGNGSGRLPTCIIATTCKLKRKKLIVD